ncbi:MAG: glycosyltransferase family 2 protein [Brevundimonas sp.]|nr:glycosyltransferase family 2 protein [Brevundimonas sp.]
MTSFYAEFLETLVWRPGQALIALYWHLTRRRVRAQNWLRRDWMLAPNAYQKWIRIVEDDNSAACRLTEDLQRLGERLDLTVMIDSDLWEPADVVRLASDLALQPFPSWELLICGNYPPDLKGSDSRIRYVPVADGFCALEAGLLAAQGTHLWPLDVGTRIPRAALLRWAVKWHENRDAIVTFADEDHLDDQFNRTLPWLKPAWQRELLLSQDYMSGACLLAVAPARKVLPLTAVQRLAPVYALLLAMTRDPSACVTKVSAIQCHRRRTAPESGQDERLQVLADHLRDTSARVEPGPFGSHVVLWPLPEGPKPLVSIIVPTKDKAGLLRACVESVLSKTTWQAYEIIIVDNNSEEVDTFTYLKELSAHERVRVIADQRGYNFSALNNAAIKHAAGSYICLLNNDTEVITGDWLERMMRHAVRSHVGAVGAKLLYPNHTIQHAGVVIGMGNAAGHAHRGLANDDPGYFVQAHITREATAVTAACLVIEKSKYLAVGGLDEKHFAIAYNDVDLCLKLRKSGLSNIYVPAAELFHYESVSRGDDLSTTHRDRYMAELGALKARWNTETYVDPLHHELLDRATEYYTLCFRESSLS